MSEFRYVRLFGRKLSPEEFGGREPRLEEVIGVSSQIHVMVATKFFDGVSWLSKEVFERSKKILGASGYEAHEGVTFTSAKGAWLVVEEPRPVEPPLGAPRNRKYVLVETKLSRSKGLQPFVVEEDFVFRGFKGEDVGYGRVTRYRYFIAAYNRDGEPLTKEQLEKTLLWKNYLSINTIAEVLAGVSNVLKKELWHLERMAPEAMKRYKVVWRDVAKEFIPAVEDSGAVPDHTVNYVAVNSYEEACYLLAILVAPQVNAVVKELSPWIGHIKPRFIKYFRIPRYDPRNKLHHRLAELGRELHQRGEEVLDHVVKEVEKIIDTL